MSLEQGLVDAVEMVGYGLVSQHVAVSLFALFVDFLMAVDGFAQLCGQVLEVVVLFPLLLELSTQAFFLVAEFCDFLIQLCPAFHHLFDAQVRTLVVTLPVGVPVVQRNSLVELFVELGVLILQSAVALACQLYHACQHLASGVYLVESDGQVVALLCLPVECLVELVDTCLVIVEAVEFALSVLGIVGGVLYQLANHG